MSRYLEVDEWRIIESTFDPERHTASESIFSIGNGHFGQRANFEEQYSGESLQGSYVAGIYYPDKTRVGWWKNGYPEYFAKVLNSCNWIGIDVSVDGEQLDLARWTVGSFRRELDMRRGILSRTFSATSPEGRNIEVEATRFCSMHDSEIACVRYSIKAEGEIVIRSYLDANVVNEDANYDETFWTQLEAKADATEATVVSQTRKTGFVVGVSMRNSVFAAGKKLELKASSNSGTASHTCSLHLASGDEVVVEKYVGLANSTNYDKPEAASSDACARAADAGFEQLMAAHVDSWTTIWDSGDIEIHGDVAAQQAIRFNIFHLNQTYTGKDARLNVGPKGFTGEKYGGSTYWDTEAYCLSFYLFTAQPEIARQLLVYRYNHLDKAIENAEKLGLSAGAALYPMVTMNGEECHNEWEITFEEIHRNGAMAYAMNKYVQATGDVNYLVEHGIEVLIGIARFWVQRANFSVAKDQYVILGVTGPNEYENNVNNNWYTNYMAAWCVRYAYEAWQWLKEESPKDAERIGDKTLISEPELVEWMTMAENIYLPGIEGTNIFLQQDGFLDKEMLVTDDLDPAERPINQHWSWDRILRSVFIKQADVLQGLYCFEDHFSKDLIKENFDYYEPMTVHESSLSPCVHAILAAGLGYEEKAYEMYMRTSRLDLDDYNQEVDEGLHITSMAGTWMAVVEGFGGLRIREGILHINTMIPSSWTSFNFKVVFRGRVLKVNVDQQGASARLLKGDPLEIQINGKSVNLEQVAKMNEQ